MGFIDRFDPDYVLVISGDHIYKMDYELMLQQHEQSGADVTIACIEVGWKEASRFGIMQVDDDGRVTSFEEKPKVPTSNLASMGVYIFSWHVLQQYLIRDEANRLSGNDFGKDVIPAMLQDGVKLSSYTFNGYWKDVGTIESLWESNMDLLAEKPPLDLNDHEWRIYSVNPNRPAHYIASGAEVINSLITEGCVVEGLVKRSVLFYGVQAGIDSRIEESVIMPGVKIGKGVHIYRSIIGEGAIIADGVMIGSPNSGAVTVIGSDEYVATNQSLQEVEQP
jgi:glucose-1-phosphate adenylyltransferase